jgi:hypothetical protein
MNELTGICGLKSIGSKKDDRKAGVLASSNFVFSVTPDKRIKIHSGKPQILTEKQFNEQYFIVEPPALKLTQRRLRSYKEALSHEKMIGESLQDYRFKIKLKGREEVISFKRVTRSSAIKRIVREFKKHDEIYEWFSGDWPLIKRG